MSRSRRIARAAAAVIGARGAGVEPDQPRETVDRVPPAWMWELDEYEGAEELSLPLYAEFGEVLRARITGGRPAKAPANLPAGDRATRRRRPRRRTIKGDQGRRGECPRTME